MCNMGLGLAACAYVEPWLPRALFFGDLGNEQKT
jgi:hypothetical protein